ncbi:MAG TPA: hypothetical protein VGA72_04365 [Anaerolineales bacterium]
MLTVPFLILPTTQIPVFISTWLIAGPARPGKRSSSRHIDDVQISRVSIVITDGNGTVFEQGNAQPGDASWWTYITTVPTNGNRHLEVTALDLLGNKAKTSWQN